MHSDNSPTTDAADNRILVVLDVDDPERTLQAVVQETDATAAEVHLLMVFPTAEYEERRRARIDADVPGPFTIEHLTQDARRIARRVGREYLGSDAERFEALGVVGNRRRCIQRVVRTHEYSQVYVPEQSHSIWQQLLGVEDLSTELTRVLPDVVSVVSVDNVGASTTRGPDADAVFESGTDPTRRSHDS